MTNNFQHTVIKKTKENILILFKYEQRQNIHVVKILELNYNVYWGYFQKMYLNENTNQIVSFINRMQKEHKFKAIIIDPEWCDVFNIATIELLEDILPVGLLLMDDSTMHDYNRILASRASFVMSGCPLSIAKYKEMGVAVAELVPVFAELYWEDAKNITPQDEATHDVLWFGFGNKGDRPVYLEALKKLSNRLNIYIYTGNQINGLVASGDLSFQKIGQLIRSSKITLNLTKTDFPFRCHMYTSLPRAEQFIFTGRPIEVGMSGGYCVSQAAPQYDLIKIKEYMPQFTNPDEMCEIINENLSNHNFLESKRKKFSEYIKTTYSAQRMSVNVSKVIAKTQLEVSRPITRASQLYYDIAFNAINASQFMSHSRKELELNLLNTACNKIDLNFVDKYNKSQHSSSAEFRINRRG